jgi:nitrite reductase (NADH) large subunit
MDYIRKRVVDDADTRQALFERLLFSLEGLPDPWAARIAGEKPREYQPLRLDKRIPAEVES